MIVDREQLQSYIDNKADLIPLHKWDKKTIRKGKVQERGKSPIDGDWPNTPKNTRRTLKIAEKGYNVGFRIGETDLIIDVDPRNFKEGEEGNGLKNLLNFLGVPDLSDFCPTVLTGSGGYHYYMRKPEDWLIAETHERFPGVEFKTKGRQVVAAGSKHPNGNMYVWDDFCPELGDQPDAPGKLLKFLKKEDRRSQEQVGTLSPQNLEKLLDQIPVEDFDTNDSWFPILCAAHHGTNGTGIEEFISWSCGDSDYQDDEELIRVRWDSLGGKKLNYTINTLYKAVLTYGGDTSVVSAQSDFDGLPPLTSNNEESGGKEPEDEISFDDIVSEKEAKTGFKPGVASELANKLNESSSEEEIITAIRSMLQAGTVEQARVMKKIMQNIKMTKGEINSIIQQVKEQIAEDLGRILAEKTLYSRFYKGNGLVFNNNGQFWAYNGKFWEPITKEYVGKQITFVLDRMRKKIDISVRENAIVSEACSILSRITAVREDALRLREKPYPVVNCNNGELWIEGDGTPVLEPHKTDSYLLQVLNVDYNPNTECPLFDKSIREIFGNFEDCEDIVRHFEEFMGYVLHPDKRPAHWWLLKGPGGDGKTTLMKILSGLLGDAVLPDSIDRFKGGAGGDNHALADLVGKLLVYDDDLNRNAILPDGTLKKLSEDGEITANPKGVQAFKFTKVCTVAMLSNGFPSTRDITRGFRRRAMVIPFNKGFHENGAIIDLAEQIIEKEIAGVLNRALEGLKRLRERGRFLEPMSCLAHKEQWLNESNPVALFISERVTLTEDYKDTVLLGDAYSIYTEWCMGHNLKKIGTKQDFRSAMEDMDMVYESIGGNKRAFRFVKIQQEITDDFDDEDDL